MRRVRVVVATSVAVLSLLAFAQMASAGEWAPGLQDHNGSAQVAQSECVYNGHDDNDLGDNALWAMTPAGGRVQSGGQLIAAGGFGFAYPGIQGEACNAHLNPLNP